MENRSAPLSSPWAVSREEALRRLGVASETGLGQAVKIVPGPRGREAGEPAGS